MAVSTQTLISLLSGTMPQAQRDEINYVNQNPGMPLEQRQMALNAAQPPAFVQQSNVQKGLSLNPTTGKYEYAQPQTGSAVSDGFVNTAGTPSLVNTQQPGEINVPYGADFLDPTLSLYGLLAQLQEQARQYNQTALYNAGNTLAGLYAAGPYSSAELAFRNAGMGLPAVGGERANIEGLIGSSTRGATGQSSVDIGGQGFSVPNTLSGQQLQGLSANPNLAGVMESYARAAGNPDIYRRSIEALVPSAYQSTGSGLF